MGIDPRDRVRPSVLRWLAYAFWARLPPRHRTWVLYDATCSTWVGRYLARLATVAVLPVLAILLFLPGPIGLRVVTAVAATSGALLFTAVWVNEATDHRIELAGWRDGLGPELRKRRAELASWMASVRRL